MPGFMLQGDPVIAPIEYQPAEPAEPVEPPQSKGEGGEGAPEGGEQSEGEGDPAADAPAPAPRRRARQSSGQFQADDPATPEKNEAFSDEQP